MTKKKKLEKNKKSIDIYINEVFKHRLLTKRRITRFDGYKAYFLLKDLIPNFPLINRIVNVVLKSRRFYSREREFIKYFFLNRHVPLYFFYKKTFNSYISILMKFRNFAKVYLKSNSVPNVFIVCKKKKFFASFDTLFEYYFIIISFINIVVKERFFIERKATTSLFCGEKVKDFFFNNSDLDFRIYSIIIPRSISIYIRQSHLKLLRNSRLKPTSSFLLNIHIAVFFSRLFFPYRRYLIYRYRLKQEKRWWKWVEFPLRKKTKWW